LLKDEPGFDFRPIDLTDREGMDRLFAEKKFHAVVNLAAQAGVRYSLINPHAYLESNMRGFLNVLEPCRHHAAEHLVYASSRSVYGANRAMPFSVHHNVDHPISLYAASKKCNEQLSHTQIALYGLQLTGVRCFTM